MDYFIWIGTQTAKGWAWKRGPRITAIWNNQGETLAACRKANPNNLCIVSSSKPTGGR